MLSPPEMDIPGLYPKPKMKKPRKQRGCEGDPDYLVQKGWMKFPFFHADQVK